MAKTANDRVTSPEVRQLCLSCLSYDIHTRSWKTPVLRTRQNTERIWYPHRMVGRYVGTKDFFYQGHWGRLPQSWRNSLSEMTPNDLRWLIDSSQNKVRQVLPLTLLSFRACTQTYSLERQHEQDIELKWKTKFLKKDEIYIDTDDLKSRCNEALESCKAENKHCCIVDIKQQYNIDNTQQCCSVDNKQHYNVWNVSETSSCSNIGTCSHSNKGMSKFDLEPVSEEGVLHYFYRKHVKPKKQHEIINLGKVIQLLSNHISCNHVVDVGGGLGHLSRLLSFGYGLKVTSIEASDGHAPKANKYDREIDKEIKKKKNHMECGPPVASNTNLPHHVTSMIYPNMTGDDFLTIIQAQGANEDIPYNSESNYQNDISDKLNFCEPNSNKHLMPDKTECMVASKVAKFDNYDTSKVDSAYSSSFHGSDKLTKFKPEATVLGNSYDEVLPEMDTAYTARAEPETDMLETDICSDISTNDICDMKTKHDSVKVKLKCNKTGTIKIKNQNEYVTESRKTASISKNDAKSNCDEDFILTGLHACGDLTPTFLRFFINCSLAKGLSSVGCCYMKLTDESQNSASGASDCTSMGYPMSSFVKSLPHHSLSYNARELACHFADTYSQRLKDNPPHLKIHSYRAALEWIANQICPEFKRSAVQIPAKKTNKMDFESYARLGLGKLGISPDLLTPDLLNTAKKMVDRWKDVVAFYTLRLSLAPVIETLVLLDRMVYLHEHGISSVMMPIFDPNISPRNFVLLAWK